MNYVQSTTEYVCGIDLHSSKMYLCIKDSQGRVKHHQNHNCSREELLKALAPYRPNISVAVESTYNWYWLGDCCQEFRIPFFLGHAFYMKSIWATKKKNDRRDSGLINDLLRHGMSPPTLMPILKKCVLLVT